MTTSAHGLGLAGRLALNLLDGGADAVVTRYGEARLDASGVLAEASLATVATGIDLWLAGGEAMRAGSGGGGWAGGRIVV